MILNNLKKSLLKFYLFLLVVVILASCKSIENLPGADARKISPDPKARVQKNIEEGRGFRLMDKKDNTGTFDFASSNELWRATLDTLDFMPLALANYSGGIIITDWYSESNSPNESIKISIRFLTNEIRSDALQIKIFNRKCTDSYLNCKFTELDGNIKTELTKEILKKATRYKIEQATDYKNPDIKKKK